MQWKHETFGFHDFDEMFVLLIRDLHKTGAVVSGLTVGTFDANSRVSSFILLQPSVSTKILLPRLPSSSVYYTY